MLSLEQIKEIARPSLSKIVLLVIDGLGGLPAPETGKTELEEAQTPNLDLLASRSICGLIDPIASGITPGSGPAHLALFGYDPLRFIIGRGVLEALGIDFDLKEKDVAARGNFCTIDQQGLVVDRRAGRISTEENGRLCELLRAIHFDDIELFVVPVKEHRFVVVFRGPGLCDVLADSDPQQTGLAPRPVLALSQEAPKTAQIANDFIARAKETLAHSHPANMVLLRGFSQYPRLPLMSEVYQLKLAAIATYPMYRGLAKLVGMELLPTGSSIEEEVATLAQHYAGYDFFYVHIKKTDSAGEDGNFRAKVQALEEVDTLLPQVLALEPEVLIVTGDHSTPAVLRAHSWHPVPLLLYSQWCRPDRVREFSEPACAQGGLGRFPTIEVMPLAMANALKLEKFGA